VNSNGKAESPINVFLLVQNRLVREVVTRLFSKQSGMSVAGTGHESTRAFDELAIRPCDVLLLDSVETLGELGKIVDANDGLKKIKVLLFGMEEDPGCFLRAVQWGACGYLLNDASSTEMIAAVRGIARGEAVCPPKLCKRLFEHVSSGFFRDPEKVGQRGHAANELTCRQRQLMALVAKGMTNKEIAATLQLSEFTVKNHIRRVMRHLRAGTRHQAVDVIRTSGLYLSA